LALKALEKLLAAAIKQTKKLTVVFTKNTLPNWLRVFGSITIGCDHWIIYDGVEGYLSQRLNVSTNTVTCIFRCRTTEHGE
jgi:hypothetical protein